MISADLMSSISVQLIEDGNGENKDQWSVVCGTVMTSMNHVFKERGSIRSEFKNIIKNKIDDPAEIAKVAMPVLMDFEKRFYKDITEEQKENASYVVSRIFIAISDLIKKDNRFLVGMIYALESFNPRR